MYSRVFKRLIDLLICITVLLLLSPMFILVAILIKLSSPGPIFFNQIRMGKGQKTFKLLKFRSMTVDDNRKAGEVFKGTPGVTWIGAIIRRLKIDELPQLINIVKGDMTIVGPRPCLPDLKDNMNEEGLRRFTVRPGLTGLAQVNGNIHLSWEQRWVFDARYVDSISFIGDCRIILKTVLVVLFGEEKFRNVQ